MKKIISTFLFIAILISPISASAMSRNEVQEQYRQSVIQLIELLMQKVEALILELNGMQSESIPIQSVLVEEKIEEKVEEEPVKWVRPPHLHIPANPKPTGEWCHAPGQLDIRVKCE